MLSGFGSADVIFRDESEVDEVIEIFVSLPLASSVRGLALLFVCATRRCVIATCFDSFAGAL